MHLVHLAPPEHLVLMRRHRSQACEVRAREDGVEGVRGPGGGCGGMALLRMFCWVPRPRGGGRLADMLACFAASPEGHDQFLRGGGGHTTRIAKWPRRD
jgi:hypothetical protein